MAPTGGRENQDHIVQMTKREEKERTADWLVAEKEGNWSF